MNDDHELRALLYESGELDPAQAAAFEAHAPSCAACRETLELARRAHVWGRAVEEGPAPELLAAVLSRPAARSPFQAVLRLAGATAFACAALAAVVFLDRPAPDLRWETDLSVRIWDVERRIGETRQAFEDVRRESGSRD